MLKIRNLHKRFGDESVLNGLDFCVDDGDFVILTGNSGAGKSTLINLILGHESIDAGDIEFLGDSLFYMKESKKQEMRRKFGVIFQDFMLLDKRSVFENVAFSLELEGVEKTQIRNRVNDALNIVDLLHRTSHFPDELSGGEKQRVSIARALVHNPRILIADEPSGNLDPDNTLRLSKLLKKINELGTTILLSTHDKDLLNTLDARVLRLDGGKIIWDKKGVNYFGEAKI